MMKRLWNVVLGLGLRTRESQAGQAFVEYGLLVMIIAIGVISTLMLMGNTVSNMYQNVNTGLRIH